MNKPSTTFFKNEPPEKKLFPKHTRQSTVQTHTRYVPRDIRREAIQENDSCCYVSPDGKRCGSKVALQFDHVRPFALGGSSLDPSNIRVLCAAHNHYLARLTFGDKVPARTRCPKQIP